jgi:uncharacterized membrane protein/sporulation protein YlmC with PRC-barrel domain
MINIPLEATVECRDGFAGQSVCVIINREEGRITHFVVRERLTPHNQREVPIQRIIDTSSHTIRLNCSLAEFSGMPAFTVKEYRHVEVPRYSGTGYMQSPVYTPDTDTIEVDVEQLDPRETTMRPGMDVLAADDKRVGEVADLVVDVRSGRISYLVIRERHIWGDKDVLLPIDLVDIVVDESVHLVVDGETFSAMLAIPSIQRAGALDITLLICLYEQIQTAEIGLQILFDLGKEVRAKVINAAVLTKDAAGKSQMKEIEDIGGRSGAIAGAITGGLLGLLGGPIGVVLGIAAGAATGGAAAQLIDTGFPNEYLQKLQDGLQPGSSSLVVLIKTDELAAVSEKLAPLGGEQLSQQLTQEMVTRLLDDNAGRLSA